MAAAVGEVGEGSDKPVVASFVGSVQPGDARVGRVPVFVFPEAAALALGPGGSLRGVAVAPDRGGALRGRCRRRGGPGPGRRVAGGRRARVTAGSHRCPWSRRWPCWPPPASTPSSRSRSASADEAVAAAEDIGWPVALKAGGLDRPSRTEHGGVAVDVFGADELRGSYERMHDHHGAAMDVALVQAMAPDGVDVRIDLVQDPVLGSMVGFGPSMGPDPVRRILPLTDADAVGLVESGPAADDLAGLASAGREALVDLLLRVSALADAVPEVAELRLAPVIVSDAVASVTDVRVVLAPWPSEPPVRRLA